MSFSIDQILNLHNFAIIQARKTSMTPKVVYFLSTKMFMYTAKLHGISNPQTFHALIFFKYEAKCGDLTYHFVCVHGDCLNRGIKLITLCVSMWGSNLSLCVHGWGGVIQTGTSSLSLCVSPWGIN